MKLFKRVCTRSSFDVIEKGQMVGHIECVEKIKNGHKSLVGKPEVEKQLELKR
jgi:hypothetical protein